MQVQNAAAGNLIRAACALTNENWGAPTDNTRYQADFGRCNAGHMSRAPTCWTQRTPCSTKLQSKLTLAINRITDGMSIRAQN